MADRDLSMGPRDGITYPIKVQYCGNCSMPIEYCEYYPEYDKCKQWLEKNLPTEFEKVKIGEYLKDRLYLTFYPTVLVNLFSIKHLRIYIQR